jgi:predicted ester cyclase
LAASDNINLVIDDLIAEGDKVVKRWTVRCTHTGEFMGVPATGNKVEVTGTTTYRVAGGKFVESWWNTDTLGMMQQMGVIPPLG